MPSTDLQGRPRRFLLSCSSRHPCCGAGITQSTQHNPAVSGSAEDLCCCTGSRNGASTVAGEEARAASKPEGLWILCLCQLRANSPWSRQPAVAGAMGRCPGSGGGCDSRLQYLQWGSSHHLYHGCIHPSYYRIHFYRIEFNISEAIFTLEYRMIRSLSPSCVSCSAPQIDWTQNAHKHQIATIKKFKTL